MNVAGAQLEGLLEQIVHGAHDRRSAGEVAQALDVVLGDLRGIGRAGRRDVVLAETLIEYGGDVLERCHRNLDVAAEHDRGGAHCGGIAGVGDRQHHLAVGRPEWKHHHLAQESPGELLHQRRRRQQVRQGDRGAA